MRLGVKNGQDEGRLRGIAALWDLPAHTTVIVELGDEDLRIARLRAGHLRPIARLPLGPLPVTRRFLRHDPPTRAELHALRVQIRRQIGHLLPQAARGGELLGIGENVEIIGRMHLRTIRDRRTCLHRLRLRGGDLAAWSGRLQDLPPRRRRQIDGLDPARADTVLATAVILEHVMALGKYPTLTTCARSAGLALRACNVRAEVAPS